MIRYVVGFMFDEGDPDVVLLIAKKNPPWQAGLANGIGGKIYEGEEPGDAMVREFKEETGMETSWDINQDSKAKSTWLPSIVLTNEVVGYRLHVFRATGPVYEAQTTTQETVFQEEWPFREYRNVIPNLNWIVPLLKDESVRFPVHVEDIGVR